jgi:hypothetical protein
VGRFPKLATKPFFFDLKRYLLLDPNLLAVRAPEAEIAAAMNVLLISANREDINMLTLPMGLACVAAAVEKAGHAVRFLD